MEQHVLDTIASAKTSLYAAVYDITLESVGEALVQAKQRGVDVRVIMDDECAAKAGSQYSKLAQLGLVKTDHSSSNFMHNKFMVIDSQFVWTGSTNFTDRGVHYNNNNSILINSKKLAQDYTTEFMEMWQDDEFGAKSPPNTPYPDVKVNDAVIECYFAPEDGVEQEIMAELSSAKNSIYFATFTFTSDPIEKVLLTKHSQGIEIKGIYEARQKSQYCSYEPLLGGGAQVIWDGSSYTMHDKFFIIDEGTVITGSFNPTKHANTSNDENILIIHNSQLASLYYSQFNSMWDEWSNENTQASAPVLIPAEPKVPESTPTPDTTQSEASLRIENIDLSGEIVTIVNDTSQPVDMTGWRLVSEVGNQEYYFPAFTLQPSANVMVVSGKNAENNPPAELLWTTTYVWNNKGDPGALYDNEGKLVSRYP